MAIQSLNENGHPIEMEPRKSAGPEKGKKRSATGIAIFCAFVLTVAGGILYFTFAPVRCPVLYRIPENVIVSPAGAEIRHLAADGPVAKGDAVAELLIRSDAGGAFLEQTHLLRDRLRAIEAGETARSATELRMRRELEELRREYALAETDSVLAAHLQDQCAAILEKRKKDLESSSRLFELEAVRHSELESVREAFDLAASEAEKARLLRKRADLLRTHLKERMESADRDLRKNGESDSARKSRDEALRKQLEEQLSRMEFIPGGVLLRIHAGADGVFCGGGIREGGEVQAGEALARIYPESSGVLEVFVPEDLSGSLTGRSRFRVSIGGKTFEASARTLSPSMEVLPNPLKGRDRDRNSAFRRVLLESPANPPELLNGQTGSAVLL